MTKLRLTLALAWCALSGAVFAAEPSIVGTWWEESHNPGYRVISIATLKPDGTYTASFRHCLPQGPADNIMSGHWTYTNRRLHLTIEIGGIVVGTDDYQTETNDGRVWTYKLVSGRHFSVYEEKKFRDVRVTPESKLPTCDTLS